MYVYLHSSSPRLVTETLDDKIISDHTVQKELEGLFSLFQQNLQLPSDQWHQKNNQLMMEHCGFQIGRLPSSLPDGGRGVYITDGQVEQGKIVAMYPGIYRLLILM